MKDLMVSENIKNKIYTIRNKQVMLDRDLAEQYAVEVKYLKRQVRRNIERFPQNFCFQLNKEEFIIWRSQFVTSKSDLIGLRYAPFAFTEQGVAMLAGILNSKKAIQVSILIIQAFVEMRHFLQENASVFQRLDRVELKQLEHDQHFNKIFKAIESKQLTPNQGIFYDGQLFEAHKFITNLIKSAKESIMLIDNYINEDTLTLLSHKKKEVKVQIYTKDITKQLLLAKDKFSKQYKHLEIKPFTKSHDRFLIIDQETYHIGASIKDAGKKWFAFSKLQQNIQNILLQ